MSRRVLLTTASAGGAALAGGVFLRSCTECCGGGQGGPETRVASLDDSQPAASGPAAPAPADVSPELPIREPVDPTHDPEARRRRAVEKAQDFDSSFHDDVVVIDERMALLRRVQQRLERAQRTVGHGHFGLYGFDELLTASRRFAQIGAFEPQEIAFLEELFSVEAADYGFFGEKVITDLSFRHPRSGTLRVRGTGHHLLRGASFDTFEKMRRDVPSLVLTSGVRGLAKQYQLFLSKVVNTEGNLSRAARSLAPPGYSHHGAGDFDVGAASLGEENFTEEFAATDEYQRLMELGYVEIRYDLANDLGVRHEPWHIRVS